jgi:hypothetical protein
MSKYLTKLRIILLIPAGILEVLAILLALILVAIKRKYLAKIVINFAEKLPGIDWYFGSVKTNSPNI